MQGRELLAGVVLQVDGYTVGNIGNTDLTWETTHRLHGGIDMNLLNNRLSLSITGFKSWTSNLITNQTLPYVIGLDQNWCNGGDLTNTGVTLDLRAKILNQKNFQWQMGLSMGHYTNEITSLQYGSFITDVCGGHILYAVLRESALNQRDKRYNDTYITFQKFLTSNERLRQKLRITKY